MPETRRPRTVKLPPPSEVDAAAVDAFVALLGYDERSRKRITSVRINRQHVQVDVRARADVKVTQSHPVVWEDDQ